jgi:hypothetical protein
MTATAATIRNAITAQLGRWLAIAFGTVALYYALLLAALVVRFENWPNYVVAYDWPGNVVRIVRSTPSLADAAMIVQDEWLLEVGYMNMSFGRGISEWSLTLVPPKMVVILVLGTLIATVWTLALQHRRACAAPPGGSVFAVSGLGTGMIALTGATMSWVVCCSTPTWIVGLAMLGIGVATANWLEPIGPYLALGGFVLLGLTIVSLARGLAPARPHPASSLSTSANSV